MQLGYTIPLQRYLHKRPPPYGTPLDLRFCWELHLLKPHGHSSLLSVHASSRYTFLLYHIPSADWADIPALFHKWLRLCLLDEGLPPTVVNRYFASGGTMEITKTHGRRPVAFLNKAVDDLYTLPVTLDSDLLEQPQVRLFLNNKLCRCAGHENKGAPREFLKQELMDIACQLPSQDVAGC